MNMTQHDYNERLARERNGEASDDDRRLIALYEREGFEPDADIPTGPEQPGADDVNTDEPVPAPRKTARAKTTR